MARNADKKYNIVKRAINRTRECGLSDYELFFDPLALPISTGIEEDRLNAKETITAISKFVKISQIYTSYWGYQT